jgi:hypothetical protein
MAQRPLVAVNKLTEMMKEGIFVLEDEYWPTVATHRRQALDRGIKGVSQRSGPTLLKNIMTSKA